MSTFQNRLMLLEQVQQVVAEPPIPVFKPTVVEQPLTSVIPVSGQLTLTQQQDATVQQPQQSSDLQNSAPDSHAKISFVCLKMMELPSCVSIAFPRAKGKRDKKELLHSIVQQFL
jgi:hypothetical protein